MSREPANPVEAKRILWTVGADIDEVTDRLVKLRDQRPSLERSYRMAYAHTYLSTEGAVEARKQKALIAADEARFALDVCDQQIETCKDQLRALRDRSEIARAINSNLKEELRTLGERP